MPSLLVGSCEWRRPLELLECLLGLEGELELLTPVDVPPPPTLLDAMVARAVNLDVTLEMKSPTASAMVSSGAGAPSPKTSSAALRELVETSGGGGSWSVGTATSTGGRPTLGKLLRPPSTRQLDGGGNLVAEHVRCNGAGGGLA